MPRKYDKQRGVRPDGKKDAGSSQQSGPPPVVGCPVPETIVCAIGKPLAPGEEGVLMVCSNDKCPFKGKMCHEQCFAAYEDHLIRCLSNMGSARGWTDAQRRANLWEKKGQSLIAKMCRCRCGLGTTRRDMEYLYSIAKTVEPQPAKKKAKKAKQLPELNFPTQRKPVNNLKDAGIKPKIARQRTESGSSSLDEAYTYKREEHTYNPGHTEPKSYGSFTSGFNIDDDIRSVSDVFSEPAAPTIPKIFERAPPPPKQTRSYASAIKSASEKTLHEEDEHDSGHESRSLSSPASPPTGPAAETGKKANNGRVNNHVVVDNDATPRASVQPNQNFRSTPHRPVENCRRREQKPLQLSILEVDDVVAAAVEEESLIYGRSVADYCQEEGDEEQEEIPIEEEEVVVEERKVDSPQVVLSADLIMDPEIVEIETLLPVEYIPDWEPLLGRGFDLAEMVYANHRLPGLLIEAA